MNLHTKSLLVLKRHKFSLLFLVFITVITYMSLAPLPELGGELWFDHLDKLIHFFIYVIFCSLGFLAIMEFSKNRMSHPRGLLLILIIAFFYGLLIEVLQHFMPLNRMFEIWDLLANSLGAIMGCWLIKRYSSLILPLK